MKVTVDEIKERISLLPPGVEKRVHRTGTPGMARVESFTTDAVYTVSIKVHKDDPGDKTILDAVCTCPASRLCKHIVAYYAVVKGLLEVNDE